MRRRATMPTGKLVKLKAWSSSFCFWVTVYYVWEPYQRGYLIQPWFIFALIVIYTFHPLIAWLSQRRGLFFAVLLTLLCCSYGYDLLSVIYPDRHLFSLPPQYRLWTWLLFYLTGQLFNDPKVAEWIRNPQVIKGSIIALPFVYLFTWFYERHFFFALFKADRNAFILTGSQIYILIVLLVIAANAVQFKKNREWKEAVLATVSKAMTGVLYPPLFRVSPAGDAHPCAFASHQVGGNSADLCPVGAHFPCRALQYAAQEGDYLVTDNGTI
ncbi:acyltransferase [Klebsiella pneumoniae]|uniref:Acyltransferase n=1 Tax=Klebsiella pneumoniae TaxID=573 RepID=A0A2X3H066_KLEPN|nr:acyltransferase [Klebsiella pneumoniae]